MAKSNPVAIAALLFFAFSAFSGLYSQATWPHLGQGIHRYAKLVYIPCLLPLLVEAKWRRRGMNAFLVAMMITMLLSYLKQFGMIHIDARFGNGTIFKNHIETSFFMSFAAYVIALRSFSKTGPQRHWYFLLLAITLVQIFCISGGRTGYLISAILFILFVWQKWHWKGLLVPLITLPIVFFVLMQVSWVFNNEVMTAERHLISYHDADVTNNSVGLRLTFFQNGLHLIKVHPVFGTGVGSFYNVYNKEFGPTPQFPHGLNDPHNEYIATTVQMGIIGLGLLFFMFWQQWRCSMTLSLSNRWQARAMLIAFMVGATFDSFLFLSTTGYFFVLMSSLFFAEYPLRKSLPTHDSKLLLKPMAKSVRRHS